MATQFIGTVAIGTALDLRGFATGIGKLRSASSAINGPLNTGGNSARFFSNSLFSAERGMNLLSNAGRAAIGIVNGVGASLMAVGRTASVVSLTTGLVGASIVKAGFNWRKTWNQARAVTAGTAEELTQLKARVFELGSSTKFTISEVAGAVDFLGRAGNSAYNQLKLLPNVLDLAAAANLDLPRTADLVTNILQGLRIDPSKIGAVGDMLTATFLNSNVTLSHLADTLKKFGPITATLGADIRDVVTSIGLLGNAGIQGSESGVHLRRMMINLSDNMSKMRTEVVDRLGLSWNDLNVQTRGFIPVMRTLSRVLLNESGKIKNAEMFGLASRLFGARAVSTALALMGQLEDGYDDLSTAVRNSAGATRETAALQLEGLEPFYRLQAAIERLKISVSESGVLDTIADLAGKIADYFTGLSGASAETRRLAFGILTLVTVGGPAIFVLGLLITSVARVGQALLFLGSVFSFLITPIGLLTVAILTVVGAAVYLAAEGTGSFKSLFDGSAPQVSALGNILMALTDVVFGVVGFVKSAIDGDWTTAWGYAKDVVANLAVVVVQIMHTLANAILLVMRNIVHWVNEHWDQIADGTIKALTWLFSTTEGWLVVFTLMMFRGFRAMVIGVLLRVTWMVNQIFGAFKWLALRLGIGGLWGKMWAGLILVTSVATKGIVAIARRFGVLFLGVFKVIGTRLAAWTLFLWLPATFLSMFRAIVAMTVRFGTLLLGVFKTIGARIAAWSFFIWLTGAFKAMYVAILAVSVRWGTLLLGVFKTIGSRIAAWTLFVWLTGAFKAMYRTILAVAVRWASLMLALKRTFGLRLAAWTLFSWFVGKFVGMFKTVLSAGVGWARAFLGLMVKFGTRLAPRVLSIMARFVNPWVAAVSIIIAAIIAFKDELKRAVFGIGSMIKTAALWIGQGFLNGWIETFNTGLSVVDYFAKKAVRILLKVINAINKIPGISIPTQGLKDFLESGVGRIGKVNIADGRTLGQAWREGSGGLTGSDFANAAKDAWNDFTKPFKEAFEMIKGFGSNVVDFVIDEGGDLAELVSDIAVDAFGKFTVPLDKFSEIIDSIPSKAIGLFKTAVEDLSNIVSEISSDVFGTFATAIGKFGTFVDAISAGDWQRAGALAVEALDRTIGEAFRFLAQVGGGLATSVLAPASKAAIEAALGGLGYVFSRLDLVLKNVKPLEDIDPEALKESIYGILEDAGITPPEVILDAYTGKPIEVEDSTPEERKESSIQFITGLVSTLKDKLADLFKVDEEGKPIITDEADAQDLIDAMNTLGLDVDELGQLWEDIGDQYDPDTPIDPSGLTPDSADGGGAGSSGPSRSLTGQLADLTLRVLVQIGDRPFEDAVVESVFSAERTGRLQGLDSV